MKSNSNLFFYFLSHFLFLGGGFAKIADISKTDMIICALLGFFLGVIILYIINKLKFNNKINECLKDNKIFRYFFKFIYIGFILFNMLVLFVILSSFLFSYFLPFTPSFIACFPFLVLAFYLGSKNIKEIYNVGFVLFIMGLCIIFLKTLLLGNEFDINNILPILVTDKFNIFKGSIIYTVLSISPCFILIDEDINFKDSFKYYFIANLTNIVVIFTICLILGNMINVYSYPEYTVLRRINFFKFIENVENFICINWFFDLFISLSLFINKLRCCFDNKKNLISFAGTCGILYVVYIFFANNYYNSIILYKVFPYICGGFVVIFILMLIIKRIMIKCEKM